MKQIMPTQIDKEQAIKAFKEYLDNYKSNSGSINFSYKYNNNLKGPKVEILISLEAHCKINTLVTNAQEEIGFHCLVKKLSDYSYFIYDVLVYPQTVTAVTVTTDELEYASWMMNLDDDTFNDIRVHGHSHVNMGVTPSATDNNFYNKILSTLDEGAFYIFMIVNKKGDMNIWFYDYSKNVIYESQDITYNVILNENSTLNQWYTQAIEDKVRKPKAKKRTSSWFDDYWEGRDYYEPK